MDGYHEYCTGGFHPDDIVITGIAGRFPDCNNVGELKDGLFSKRKLTVPSDERYEKGACGLSHNSLGVVRDLDKFDADFFCFPYSTANLMTPESRKILEVSYEAMLDAGYDPSDLKGANIGVYTATISGDAYEITTCDNKSEINTYMRCFIPSRASYFFDFVGPCYTMDSGCSSSATALWNAVTDIREGRCEAAVVNGCQLDIDPRIQVMYERHKIASKSGISNPLDASTEGIVRSEAVNALFIQKASAARRVYASIPCIKYYGSGYVPEGITVPSHSMQVRISKEVLEEMGMTPNDIDYFEAHGTGTPVGDPIELNAIAEVYCKTRRKPLNITSVKSSIGHTEAASAISSAINVIIAFETGLISPHPTYSTPNPSVSALREGKLHVVTERQPLTGTHAIVNSFGIGGGIGQFMLKQNPVVRSKATSEAKRLPRLVLYPATTEAAVNTVLEYVDNNPELTPDFFALLDQLSFTPTFQKHVRGFGLYHDGRQTVTQVKNCTFDKREVWFVMTGMGCQWPGMGAQLMEIEAFAKSMKESAGILKEYGFDLFKSIHPDTHQLDKDRYTTPAFTAITAIQVALVDVLRSLGIEPDGIIGHSAGEVAAAYADGSCDRRQTILSAYYRSTCVNGRKDWPDAAMAVIGLSWEETQQRCPQGVYPACDNSDDSVTVSGPKKDVEKFVEDLTKENIFARNLYSYGYGFHSPYVYKAADKLLADLKKAIPKPNPRSPKWVSSSYPESEWGHPDCRVAGPEYFTHNMTSPVRFREAMQRLPHDAVTLEIGPHALLQSILKRATGTQATHVGLMKRADPDNVRVFLQALGQMYNAGLNPKVERLYPPVKFPVARGTPLISDLVRWNHSMSFPVPKWSPSAGHSHHEFQTSHGDSYLLHHHIDGRSLFPAAGFVFLAWEALAEKLQNKFEDVPVILQNFVIHRPTIISQNTNVKFFTNILTDSGRFEIMEGNSLAASGQIQEWTSQIFAEPDPVYHVKPDEAIPGPEIYNELKMAGYEYGPTFRGLLEINSNGSQGLVSWDEKWIPFIDSLLLFFGMINLGGDFKLPTRALSIKIHAPSLRKKLSEITGKGLPVTYNASSNICRTSGVEITKLVMELAPRRPREVNPTFEEYKFIPYLSHCDIVGVRDANTDNYKKACNTVIDSIGASLNMDTANYKFALDTKPKNNILPTDNDNKENFHILKTLTTVSENIKNIKKIGKEMFSNYVKKLGSDLLNSDLINKNVLDILTEVIVENSSSKLDVLEINRSSPTILPMLLNTGNKFPFVKFKKSVLVSSADSAADEDVLQEYEIQKAGFDYIKNSDEDQDFIISSFTGGDVSELHELLHSTSKALKPNGFLVLFHKEKLTPPEKLLCTLCEEQLQLRTPIALERMVLDNKFTIASKIFNSNGLAVYLLRKIAPASPYSILKIVDDDSCEWVDDLKKLMSTEKSGTVWLVGEDTPSNGIIGLVNCLRLEPGGERVRCVFIPPEKGKSKMPSFSFKESCYKELFEKDLKMNIYRGGAWGSFKHTEMNLNKATRKVEHSALHSRKFGDLSSFEWRESAVHYAENTEKKLVHIYYSALNFKDVMLATGKLSSGAVYNADEMFGDSLLGLEFSGRDTLGQRVAGFVGRGGLATATLVRAIACINVPASWTLEEAATVPIVYVTCYYALLVRGQLKRGESVLIHSATGGVGMAAVYIARSFGCEIFVTVGSEAKRKYLKKKFPNIRDENIGYSRDTTFEHMIMERTNGKGVDVVLNSLADDKFLASVRCIAEDGRYLEIGKYDLSLDRPLGLKVFLKNISFHGVELDALFENTPKRREILKDVMKLVRDGITSGVVQPLDRTVFLRDAAEEAFRFMAKGTHVGKVLLKIRDEEMARISIPSTLELPAIPITYFYPWKTYIIIGGLGGFGIEVTKWMLSRGARNIILTTRTSSRTPYQVLCLMRWKKAGYNVRVSTLNVIYKRECEILIKEVLEIGPIGGIINSALYLKDAFIDSLTVKDCQDVCLPKATATKYLDEMSRKWCPALDHFICFSSISCGRGNAGQISYGYANSVMERICEDRLRDGLPGLAIQWGIIGGVGVVHRRIGDDAHILGVAAQGVRSCLEALDIFCLRKVSVTSSYVAQIASVSHKAHKDGDSEVLNQIAKVIGVKDVSEVNSYRNFGEMGIDSMISVELKVLLESACDMSFTPQDILNLKMDDVRALIKKARSDSVHSVKATPLVTAQPVSIPKKLESSDVIFTFNEKSKGSPVVVVNIGNIEPESFETLAQALGQPVFILLWTKDTPSSDLASTAAWYLKVLHSKVGEAYHLVGFDVLGGALAFEMALQRLPLTLTLMDGSDQLLAKLGRGEPTADAEGLALTRFVQQFLSEDLPQMEEELDRLSSLEERTNLLLDFLSRSSSEEVERNDVSRAITSYLTKSQMVDAYSPKGVLQQELILVEDPAQLLANDISEVKKLLFQMCKGKITIHRIFCRHDLTNKEVIKEVSDILKPVFK